MSQSSAIAASRDGELVSPEGTQERTIPAISSHQTAVTPHDEPGGNLGFENTGY